MKVRFCGSCRRLILADFSYCPYCGLELVRGDGLADMVDAPFERLERRRARLAVDDRIAELEAQLELIEAELEIMLATRDDN
jgi:hypothetical protein